MTSMLHVQSYLVTEYLPDKLYFFAIYSFFTLKWAAEEINPKIRECLEVYTKLFLIRYMSIFLTTNGLFTIYTYCIGEKLVKYFAQKTIVLLCKSSKLIEVR